MLIQKSPNSLIPGIPTHLQDPGAILPPVLELGVFPLLRDGTCVGVEL